MNKIIICITIITIAILGIFSVIKYSDMSICCGLGCDIGSPQQCMVSPLNTLGHHLEMVNGWSMSIVSFLFLILPPTALFFVFSRKLTAKKINLLLKCNFQPFKNRQKLIGFNMTPFSKLRLMLARGLLGSRKHFA